METEEPDSYQTQSLLETSRSRKIRDREGSLESWLILALIYTGITVTYGMTSCVGVFHVVFLDDFQEGNGATSWIGSINTAFTMFSATICGFLTTKLHCRMQTMIGVVLCTLGLLVSSYATSVTYLYISYGLLTGCGVGAVYMGLCTCLTQTFEKYLAFTSGFSTSAIGLSTLIYPPVIKLLMDTYGWRASFTILSAIVLQYGVLACLTKPPVPPLLGGSRTLQLYLLKELRFVFYLGVCLGQHMGTSIVFVHLEAFAIDFGVDVSSWLIPVYGLSNCVGRFLLGAIGNLPRVDPLHMVIGLNFLSGLCVLPLPHCTSDLAVISCVVSYGLTCGVNGYTAFALSERYFERESIPTAYGYILMADGVGFLFGAPLAGLVYDVTQQYSWSMYIGGGITSLVTVFLLPELFGLNSKPRQITHLTSSQHTENETVT